MKKLVSTLSREREKRRVRNIKPTHLQLQELLTEKIFEQKTFVVASKDPGSGADGYES